jgi:hypothetical protein
VVGGGPDIDHDRRVRIRRRPGGDHSGQDQRNRDEQHAGAAIASRMQCKISGPIVPLNRTGTLPANGKEGIVASWQPPAI